MAQARTGLEYDENGVPYYKWPPFPDTPSGVSIIPYNEFKPSGIQMCVGLDDDEVEVDGLGIPTVRLQVTHDLDAPAKKKKKAKKMRNGEQVVKRYVWWEEWEAGEDLRSSFNYNQMLPAEDRLRQAAVDFVEDKHREWPTASTRVREWFDKFIFFIGLDNNAKLRPKYRKIQEEEEEADEVSDDQDDGVKAAQPQNASQVKIEEFDEKRHKIRDESTIFAESNEQFMQRFQRQVEAQGRRREAFLINPELAIRIFFSSHFRDSGMMWENLALRDAPRVVIFFLKFLVRNRALYDIEKEMRAAIKVAEKAKEELWQTKQIGMKIPDELASCLTTIYGSRLKKVIWPTHPAPDDSDTDEPQAKKAKLDEKKEAAPAEFNTELKANGITLISEDVVPPATLADTAVVEPEADGGGWSSLGLGSGGSWGDDSNANDMDDNPWAQAPTLAGWDEPVHNLMSLLGPTVLPLMHTVGYVEASTRYIASWVLPDVSDKAKELDVGSFSDPYRLLARVVLKPYPVFAIAERAAIQRPEILEDPLAGKEGEDAVEKPRVPRHDPEKDSITLLLDPKAAKELVRGIGLGGTFVQVVPDYATRATFSVPQGRGRGRGHGRGRGGSHASTKSQASSEIFWYAEKVIQVIPSFWTEKQT
ncbi:hypothetical protein DFH11DRAFT_1850368 [Phellopilus nigrolimitatus]|nr:hypothetical protein DFH11DRAFT_1850368 [Phellopilus nigrolimitatus]